MRSVFLNSAIDRRFLTLPPQRPDGTRAMEVQGELLAKHKAQAVDMGVRAVQECLKNTGADLSDVGYLCCVTTTGLLTPGSSALLIRDLGIDCHSSRLDVVGMGCNAGLNALNAVAGWASAHPRRLARHGLHRGLLGRLRVGRHDAQLRGQHPLRGRLRRRALSPASPGTSPAGIRPAHRC